MTSPLKRDTWQQHIHAWQQSQLSKKDYCQHHQLSSACFYKWYSKLSLKPLKPAAQQEALTEQASHITLIPITRHLESPALSTTTVAATDFIRLHSPRGWRIDCPIRPTSDTLHTIGQLVSMLP